VHTVFQIAGPETPGLLAEITELLSHNGLEIRTAAVSSSAVEHLQQEHYAGYCTTEDPPTA
jgi:hypothetical protein